ncbi:DnaA regulatory inactivator Hda [Pasteurella canis]|uniref:Chromosomal replication control, initiator (DnaA)/regulator (Hda) n=1 Tax=Pasteurella canis TaxID=753 RepID=A0A379EV74_9PAST|nr:DnaA regulatory inactivator Hda [Pasteurella canis]UAX41443.1 DnaA regulatory inactivator Hda [Pasteurella canis]SUC10318.1 chromosomal replication control, initiator (DnaA)/regulator (Hda) [Pasteurella canis]
MLDHFQLPLPIHQLDDETLENFYPDNNLLLLNSLRKNFTQPEQQFFYIWGEQGSGKSHLLKAITNEFFIQQRPAMYVPLEKSHYFSPAVLENLEYQQLVCLDNLHSVITIPEWELAIFDLFNRIKTVGKTILVISASQSPTALCVNLPDLASRLRWGESYQLNPLNDQQKIHVLKQNAHQRGIDLSDEVANFLLKRLERDMHTLFNALKKLDHASLQAKRKLTIPFVKEILNL